MLINRYKWVALPNTTLGVLIVTINVLVVRVGRPGDMFGRTRTYNLGFAVFSILLAATLDTGRRRSDLADRDARPAGVGGALLLANSTAILTDAFPADQRGLALGINQVAAISGAGARHRGRRQPWDCRWALRRP